MAPRLKAPAQAVPQSLLEAEALAVEIGEAMREVAQIEGDLAAKIAKLQLDAKTRTAPIGVSIKAKFAALTTFAQAHRDEILPPRRKSLAIAAGIIGWKFGNSRVEIDKDMDDAIIEFLQANGGEHFLVETVTISKQALLADPEFAAKVPHLEIKQTEQFYFKLLDIDLEQSKNLGSVPVKDAA